MRNKPIQICRTCGRAFYDRSKDEQDAKSEYEPYDFTCCQGCNLRASDEEHILIPKLP